MKILNISGKNVKGRTFSHDLAPVTMFVGSNATGKTAVMVAIELALRPKISPGNYPAIDPLFAGFVDMAVAANTDEGLFSRLFQRNGDSIKMAADNRPEFAIPPVALDADVYFGLSVAKRTQFVASMVKLPDTFSKEAVIAELKNKLVLPEGRNTAETQTAVNFIMEAVDSDPVETSVQSWLDARIEDFTKRKQNCLANKQRMEKSAQASVQIGAQQDAVALESIPSLEAEIKALQTAINTLIEARGKASTDHATAKGKLEADMMKAFTSQKPAIVKELAAIESEIISVNAMHALQVRNLETESEVGFVSRRVEIDAEKMRVFTKQGGLRGLIESTVRQRDVLAKKIADIESLKECPTCKASSEGWRDAVESSLKADLAEAQSKLEISTVEFNYLSARLVELNDELSKDIEAEKKHYDERYSTGLETLEKALGEKRIGLFAKKAMLNERLAEDSEAEKKHYADNVVDGIAKLNQDLAAEQSKLDGQINSKKTELTVIQNRLKVAIEVASQAKRKAQEQAERMKAVDDYDLHVIALDTFKDFQGQMVSEAFKKLLISANLVADAVLKSPLQYRDGELGRVDDQNRWINSRCFSGTEQAALYAAMSFALATDAGFSIVRVDELGRLDPQNKKRFIDRMVQLVCDGKLEQFLGIDVTASPYDQTEGVKVIELV